MFNLRKYLLVIFFVLTGYLCHGQTVAVVLSGGGAKAYSHIGVLKALEENNIYIDYIVGNSMGAVIGALYSSGYSPEEIEVMLTGTSFINFTKENNKRNSCYYQEDEANASFVSFTFKVEKGFNIQIPLSVYDFKEIDFKLMEYMAYSSARSNSNFDSLMIPFRCIATDIDSSKLVVFRNGNLAKSVRASITFPFFVRPITIDSVLFFDGGMYDNFPVNIAINEFDPDIIIGSKAVNNYSSPEPDNAITLLQSMLMTKADFDIDSTLGVVIESNTGIGTIFQFNDFERYIDSGYSAAQKSMETIKKRIYTKNITAAEKRKKYNAERSATKINSINFSGLSKNQSSYFRKLLGRNNHYNTTDDFFKFYSCLISNENITSVYPQLEYDVDSGGFNLNLHIKKAEPFKLGVGGYVSSSGVNEGYLGLSINQLGRNSKIGSVEAYFGTYYNSFSTMGKIEFPSRVPITLKAKLLISRKNYFSNARYFFEDSFPAYIITDENYFDFSGGIPLGKSGVLNAGLSNINAQFQYYQDNYFTRTDTADISNFYFLSPYFEFEINSLNKKMYPTSGSQVYGGIIYYGGNEKYTKGSGKAHVEEFKTKLSYWTLLFKFQQYINLSSKVNIGFNADIGFSSKPLLDSYISSLLIAIPYQPIPVMKSLFLENYRSNNYAGLGCVADYNFYRRFSFRVDGYYYFPYKKIMKNNITNSAYYSAPFSYAYFTGSARVIFKPPIGVISASVNYLEKPGSKFGFLLNLGYLIFNKSKLNH